MPLNPSFLATDDYHLNVSRGLTKHASSLFKFGYSANVGSTVTETVWDGGTAYTYPAVSNTVVVTSDGGASDSGLQILVSGLDANYAELEETVTLSALGTANTGNTFSRVFRSYNAGSTEMNSVTDYMVLQMSGSTVAQFSGEDEQTLMAVYTVPAGKTLYIKRAMVSSGTENGNRFIRASLVARRDGGVFRTAAKFSLKYSSFDGVFEYPLAFPAKTDIEVRAITSSSTAEVAASFEGVLIDEAQYLD